MRILLIAFGILTVFWSTPAIELGVPADRVSAMPHGNGEAIGAAGASGPGDVGRDSLVFVVVPRLDTMPVMPDLPQRLVPPTMMDEPPVAGAVRALIDPGSVVPTSARRDFRQVTALSLNMRSGPANSAAVLTTLKQGDGAFVTGAPKRGWVPVQLAEDGQRGWVFGTFLKPKDS